MHQSNEMRNHQQSNNTNNNRQPPQHPYFLRSVVRNTNGAVFVQRDMTFQNFQQADLTGSNMPASRSRPARSSTTTMMESSNSNSYETGMNGAVKRGIENVEEGMEEDMDDEEATSNVTRDYNNNYENQNSDYMAWFEGASSSAAAGPLFEMPSLYGDHQNATFSSPSMSNSSYGAQLRRSPAKKPRWIVTRMEVYDFFRLVERPTIKEFLRRDSCCLISDKYAIAMVFTYFKRAKFSPEEFTVYNFFLALYLASDIEEDVEEYKYEIFPWALGSKWRSKFGSFLRKRDELLRRIGYRAIVSRKCCEEVMNFVPEHFVWTRERKESHGGAIRSYMVNKCRKLLSIEHKMDDEELTMPRGPGERPRPCPLCLMNHMHSPSNSSQSSIKSKLHQSASVNNLMLLTPPVIMQQPSMLAASNELGMKYLPTPPPSVIAGQQQQQPHLAINNNNRHHQPHQILQQKIIAANNSFYNSNIQTSSSSSSSSFLIRDEHINESVLSSTSGYCSTNSTDTVMDHHLFQFSQGLVNGHLSQSNVIMTDSLSQACIPMDSQQDSDSYLRDNEVDINNNFISESTMLDNNHPAKLKRQHLHLQRPLVEEEDDVFNSVEVTSTSNNEHNFATNNAQTRSSHTSSRSKRNSATGSGLSSSSTVKPVPMATRRSARISANQQYQQLHQQLQPTVSNKKRQNNSTSNVGK